MIIIHNKILFILKAENEDILQLAKYMYLHELKIIKNNFKVEINELLIENNLYSVKI